MRKLTALLVITSLVVLLPPLVPSARAECAGLQAQLKPFAFEQITVSSVSKALTAATFASGSLAIISVESNPVRYRSDGSDPTSAVGHPAVAGDQLEVCGFDALTNFRAIRSGGSDATFEVTYFKGN